MPRVSIVAKELVYRSEIYLTPLRTATLIDADGVRKIAEMESEKAGYRPTDVDTGAVIITGESARKENAALVIEKMSDFAGEFVVSTAGPDLESVIAGKGSGAFSYSKAMTARWSIWISAAVPPTSCSLMEAKLGGFAVSISAGV